jgi:hypothetical protein
MNLKIMAWATALASAVAGVPQAHAGLVYGSFSATETLTGGLDPTELTGTTAGPSSQILNIDQADPLHFGAGYRISGITLSLSGILETSITAVNSAARGNVSATGTVSSTFSLQSSNLSLETALSAFSVAESVATNTAPVRAGGSSVLTAAATLGPNTSNLALTSRLFSLFEGAGQVQVGGLTSGTTDTLTPISPTLTVGSPTTNDAESELTITYAYSQIPVPEPASALILASGLLGLGALRMRRRTV